MLQMMPLFWMSNDSSDEVSDSQQNFVGTFVESVKTIAKSPPPPLPESPKEILPHLLWRASASPPDSLPVSFDCLLDNSSHLVLIHNSLVTQLRLCKKKLKTPIETVLTMHLNDNEASITFYNFVKFPLYHARTVHAIVMKNLCCPVLLGLPFLSHNKIIIDHTEQTAIDNPRTMIFYILLCIHHPGP